MPAAGHDIIATFSITPGALAQRSLCMACITTTRIPNSRIAMDPECLFAEQRPLNVDFAYARLRPIKLPHGNVEAFWAGQFLHLHHRASIDDPSDGAPVDGTSTHDTRLCRCVEGALPPLFGVDVARGPDQLHLRMPRDVASTTATPPAGRTAIMRPLQDGAMLVSQHSAEWHVATLRSQRRLSDGSTQTLLVEWAEHLTTSWEFEDAASAARATAA
mmetsp:Transcript_33131/g.85453  ORF Transcript_33131/g.85453 Transcript_33131/m.85453 type:complete len:217 (+) Transcript_33131:1177-1827(+)